METKKTSKHQHRKKEVTLMDQPTKNRESSNEVGHLSLWPKNALSRGSGEDRRGPNRHHAGRPSRFKPRKPPKKRSCFLERCGQRAEGLRTPEESTFLSRDLRISERSFNTLIMDVTHAKRGRKEQFGGSPEEKGPRGWTATGKAASIGASESSSKGPQGLCHDVSGKTTLPTSLT